MVGYHALHDSHAIRFRDAGYPLSIYQAAALRHLLPLLPELLPPLLTRSSGVASAEQAADFLTKPLDEGAFYHCCSLSGMCVLPETIISRL